MPGENVRKTYIAALFSLQSSQLNIHSGVKVPAVLLGRSVWSIVPITSIKRGRNGLARSAEFSYDLHEPDRAMNLPIASVAVVLVRLWCFVLNALS